MQVPYIWTIERIIITRVYCVCVVDQVEAAVDQVKDKLLLVRAGKDQLEEKEKSELKKRKLLSEV